MSEETDAILTEIPTVMQQVRAELDRAMRLHPRPQASAHEGLAVLEEEVAEFRAIVYQKQKDRDLDKMREELVQIAAVAIRTIVEVVEEGRGRA